MATRGGTRLYATEVNLPAARLGPENPLPPLLPRHEAHEVVNLAELPDDLRVGVEYGTLPSTLPCLDQDGYTRSRSPLALAALLLENRWLRATVLPSLGGRLYSLVDREADRELLFRNSIWQPANLALRNAWFAGGVEWNLGSTGHTTLTCEPVHAGAVTGPDGSRVLRLWEWERTRNLVQQIDLWLPPDSHWLFVGVRIRNPYATEVPAYWWSNIAVPQTPSTRVLVPADRAWHFGYGHRLELVSVPSHDDRDLTYPMRHRRAADFFFDLPDGQRPWIAALDERGAGLAQVSTRRLRGRKLFVWGETRGGRRWQEWLGSPDAGDGYAEIQAGLARTQLEHLRLPGHTEWDWLEAYGPLAAPPEVVHQPVWSSAWQGVDAAVGRALPAEELDRRHAAWLGIANDEPGERLAIGSGWGALERRRASRSGCQLALAGTPFDDATLTASQQPWLALLDGDLPDADPLAPPDGTLVAPGWRAALERAGGGWLAEYHRGVARWYAGDRAGAVAAWRRSVATDPTPWALRNLAIAAQVEGHADDVVAYYVRALELAPDCLPLAIEATDALLALGRPDDAAAVLDRLPATISSAPRMALARVRVLLARGDAERAQALLDEGIELPDVREGTDQLAEIWAEIQRGLGTARPLPARYDFGMTASPGGGAPAV